LDIDWSNETFNIIHLDANSLLEDTKYGASYNMPSNLWIYLSGGTEIATGLSFDSYNKASVGDTGFSGWGAYDKHYAATFDFAAISGDIVTGTLFHNTMECGNDNLLGVDPVPEPVTLILFGVGLVGLTGFIRKKKT
jgi:PEP-CTERM motif